MNLLCKIFPNSFNCDKWDSSVAEVIQGVSDKLRITLQHRCLKTSKATVNMTLDSLNLKLQNELN